MRLYVDEDIASTELLSRLRSSGHEVIEPLRGASDAACWRHAQGIGAVVLTMNIVDFVALAAAGPAHHGVLLVYRQNDPTTDMTPGAVAAAVDRIASTYPEGIRTQTLVVNQFRW